uniref:Uncharacterized protein n=1 Tax=Anguilla anguilla TaxID=7936 RepID=A0A0E9QVU5_ANGAN
MAKICLCSIFLRKQTKTKKIKKHVLVCYKNLHFNPYFFPDPLVRAEEFPE